jgi:hypothetical protein
MKSLTLLFYAAATFCLGPITAFAGGAQTLARIFRAQPVIQNGFTSYPVEPWQSILLGGALGLSLIFLAFALYFAITTEPAQGFFLVPGRDEDGDGPAADAADGRRRLRGP